MNLLQSIIKTSPRRSLISSWDDYVASFAFDGHQYPVGTPQQTLGFKQEEIETTFTGLARSAYKGNGVVFACMEVRRALFSEARFQWQRVRGGTPGELFGTEALALLERPWTNATTGDLMSRAIQDADLAGNAFIVKVAPDRLGMLRPDWVTIVAGSQSAPDHATVAADAQIIGYAYWPGGKGSGSDPVIYLPNEVAHFAPTPDPFAKFRGMSWLTPLVREVMADNAATTHKLKFFENGATPNMVVSLDASIPKDKFEAFIEAMDQKTKGVQNAYQTLYVGGGASVEVVGSDMKQLDFKLTQGAGETRIAAAAQVPPILVGLSEGLQSGTYSNYGQARRRFADGTIWPLWRNMAGSLESILPPPAGAQLWVDARRIPFFQEDEKDRAEIQQLDSSAINSLVTSGYTPESVVAAVTSGDLSRLVHSGLYSVQLQPANSQPEPMPEPDRSVNVNVTQPERAEPVVQPDHSGEALLHMADRSAHAAERTAEFMEGRLAQSEAAVASQVDTIAGFLREQHERLDARLDELERRDADESEATRAELVNLRDGLTASAASIERHQAAIERLSEPVEREVERDEHGTVVAVIDRQGDRVIRRTVERDHDGRITRFGEVRA